MTRLPRPGAAASAGPFETEREARETPAVRAVHEAFRADPGTGMTPRNLAMLTDATTAAGVELGAFDHRIVQWLAGFEPATCAVIAGLVTRAARRPSAHGWELVARQAIRDAIRWAESGQSTAEDPAGQVGLYRGLARALGIDLGPGGAEGVEGL